MNEPFDQAKHDQMRDHIAGLESAAESVEVAASRGAQGSERQQTDSLARRLRRAADQLRDELEELRRGDRGQGARQVTS